MINSSLALIQERIDANKMLLEEKESKASLIHYLVPLYNITFGELDLKVEMEAKLLMLDEERKTISDQLTIFERLLSVFGPRGIQSYIFKGIISQIEVIANSYLEVLAAGGIHLSLFDESEDYTEKIMKSVWIRGNADGKLKERGLSQLSGGQWRRVSMALDLAFAELVRRKGVLRCNLIVMDEVLTHLDASGREAVGTVLRAMVAHSQDHVPVAAISAVGTASSVTGLPKIDNSEEIDFSEANTAQVEEGASSKMMQLMEARIASSGAYETVLVILQDLAAVELEEAFDYVDVVVKSSDISTVIIDGQD